MNMVRSLSRCRADVPSCRLGQVRVVPQRQKSKGSLIITAALELSTNQVTHFYSEKKNTAEMIKLLEILVKQYAETDKIYLSGCNSWIEVIQPPVFCHRACYPPAPRGSSRRFSNRR